MPNDQDASTRLVRDIFATTPADLSCDQARGLIERIARDGLSDVLARQRHPALWHHFRFCPDCRAEYTMLMELVRREAAGLLVRPDGVPPAPAVNDEAQSLRRDQKAEARLQRVAVEAKKMAEAGEWARAAAAYARLAQATADPDSRETWAAAAAACREELELAQLFDEGWNAYQSKEWPRAADRFNRIARRRADYVRQRQSVQDLLAQVQRSWKARGASASHWRLFGAMALSGVAGIILLITTILSGFGGAGVGTLPTTIAFVPSPQRTAPSRPTQAPIVAMASPALGTSPTPVPAAPPAAPPAQPTAPPTAIALAPRATAVVPPTRPVVYPTSRPTATPVQPTSAPTEAAEATSTQPETGPYAAQRSGIPAATATEAGSPAPDQAVRDYYALINARQYDQAWGRLTDKFKCCAASAPLTRTDYDAWWDKVAQVIVGQVTVAEEGSSSATVHANLRYQLKAGNTLSDVSYIHLVRDPATLGWMIDGKGTNP